MSLSYELKIYILMRRGNPLGINYPEYHRGLAGCSVNECESQADFLEKKKTSEAIEVTFEKFTNKPFLLCKAKLSCKIFPN